MSKRHLCECGSPAGKSEFNMTGILCCQACSKELCDMHAYYGNDLLPRCIECHEQHAAECKDCKGDKERHHCEVCEYDDAY